MARPRKGLPTLSPHQAHFVLEAAATEGKISAGDVNRYLGQMHEEISTLEERLARLRDAVVAPVERMFRREEKAAPAAPVPTRQQRRKKRKAASNPSMQLQGQYLGYIKQIPQKDRAKYKAIVKSNGREAAVAAMKKALGK